MNKTAVITGAASGLGYELTLLLANDAYNLILVDIDNEKLHAVKDRMEASFNINVKILCVKLTVAKFISCSKMFSYYEIYMYC